MGNVKGKSTGQQILDPSSTNKMSESDTHISHRFELKTAKLTVVNEIIGDYMKLYSIADGFFNEFTQCVQEDDRSKHLWGVIQYFVGFRDNDSWRDLEIRQHTGICNGDNIFQACAVFENNFEVSPW